MMTGMVKQLETPQSIIAAAKMVFQCALPLLRPDLDRHVSCPCYELPRYAMDDALNTAATVMGATIDPEKNLDLELPSILGLSGEVSCAYDYISFVWQSVKAIKPQVAHAAHFKVEGFTPEPVTYLRQEITRAQTVFDPNSTAFAGNDTDANVHISHVFSGIRRDRLFSQQAFRMQRTKIKDGNVVLVFGEDRLNKVAIAARSQMAQSGGLYPPYVFLIYDHGKFTLETNSGKKENDGAAVNFSVPPSVANMDEFPQTAPRTVVHKFLIEDLDCTQSGPGGDARNLLIRIDAGKVKLDFVDSADAASICADLPSFNPITDFESHLAANLRKLGKFRDAH